MNATQNTGNGTSGTGPDNIRLERYRDWSPTAFDPTGLNLDSEEENRQDWYVLPVMQTRDSGPMEESNFSAALDILGGESDTVEVHRFGHWGPGWFEIILIHPDRAADGQAIADRLEDYPLLDEDDLCEREHDAALESWEFYGAADFRKALARECLIDGFSTDKALDLLDYAPDGDLWELYCDNSNIPYESDGDGVRFPRIEQAAARAHEKDRKALADLLRTCRAIQRREKENHN